MTATKAGALPPEERQALESLYKATDGDHWKNHEGWMGPAGTECDWHGVICGRLIRKPNVLMMELSENNLRGVPPKELGNLSHLEHFGIYGNELNGLLPQQMLERWLSGPLWIAADTSQFTNVTHIEYELNPTALLCAQERIAFEADGRARMYKKLCRNQTPDDRRTYCEVKLGKIPSQQFGRLAWLLDANEFYGLHAHYDTNMSDAAFETTRVTRAGRKFEVENYGGAGPVQLWVIQSTIEGVAAQINWEKTTTQPACPNWGAPLSSWMQ